MTPKLPRIMRAVASLQMAFPPGRPDVVPTTSTSLQTVYL